MLTYSVVYVVLASFAGRLSDTFSPQIISVSALVSGAAASFFFALTMHVDGMAPSIIYLLWLAVSMAFFFPTTSNMVMRALPQKYLGTGAGTFWTFCHLGSLIGVCVYGTVFSNSLSEGFSESLGVGLSLNAPVGPYRNAFILGGCLTLGALLTRPFFKNE